MLSHVRPDKAIFVRLGQDRCGYSTLGHVNSGKEMLHQVGPC